MAKLPSLRETMVIRLVLESLKDLGYRIGKPGDDGKTMPQEDLMSLAAGMLTYVLRKQMTVRQLERKLAAVVEHVESLPTEH